MQFGGAQERQDLKEEKKGEKRLISLDFGSRWPGFARDKAKRKTEETRQQDKKSSRRREREEMKKGTRGMKKGTLVGKRGIGNVD